MIDKLSVVTAVSSSIELIEEALIWYTDRGNASLRLNCAIVHLTCACAPKIFRYAMLLHQPALNSQSFWGFINGNDRLGFGTATKTTSVLLQFKFIHIYNNKWQAKTRFLSSVLETWTKNLTTYIMDKSFYRSNFHTTNLNFLQLHGNLQSTSALSQLNIGH